MQGDRRAAPETLRHALVPARRDRHPDPALPASQRPLGRDLAAAAQPGRSGLNPRLTAARTQTIEVSQVTRESPTNLSHTPALPTVLPIVGIACQDQGRDRGRAEAVA